MIWCPICRKRIPLTNGSNDQCPDCLKDFEAKRWKFKLPDGLEQDPTFYEYMEMGEVFERLSLGYLTAEGYDEEMAKLVKKINLQTKIAAMSQLARQKSQAYAESLLR